MLSLKDSGKLYYDGVETDFIKEIALTIDESEDNVMVTVNYLVTQRLIEVISENDEYFLTEIPSLIGSETASTRRSRKYRKQKALQCNTNATLCNIMQRRDRYRGRKRNKPQKHIVWRILKYQLNQ